jgi:hypothetical protein
MPATMPATEQLSIVIERVARAIDVSRRTHQPYIYAAKVPDVQRLIDELLAARSDLPKPNVD